MLVQDRYSLVTHQGKLLIRVRHERGVSFIGRNNDVKKIRDLFNWLLTD